VLYTVTNKNLIATFLRKVAWW